MKFNLKHGRLDGGVVHDFLQLGCEDVANSDVTAEALSNECFHGLPGLLVSNAGVENHFRSAAIDSGVVVDPLRWVSLVDGNKHQMDWEVNQV